MGRRRNVKVLTTVRYHDYQDEYGLSTREGQTGTLRESYAYESSARAELVRTGFVEVAPDSFAKDEPWAHYDARIEAKS